MSRLPLALTDDDPAKHGSFETCVQTVDCYKNTVSMLCVFHGVVTKFHERIYPLLPHTHKDGVKVLTGKDELYGKFIVFLLVYL